MSYLLRIRFSLCLSVCLSVCMPLQGIFVNMFGFFLILLEEASFGICKRPKTPVFL